MRRRLSQQDSLALLSCNSRPETSLCNSASHPCCLCWCCCCSFSCLTPRNQDKGSSRGDSSMFNLGSLQQTEGRYYAQPQVHTIPGPSVMEASSWALSFTALMESPAGQAVFMDFLRSEHSDENMLFWQACEGLKSETRRTAIAERAKQIYLDYISILSPKEVSIDANVRETINNGMAAPTAHIFDEAQVQIYALMHRDSYPRFLNSLLYQSLLQNLGPAVPSIDS